MADDKEVDYGELFFGIKAGESIPMTRHGEEGILFNPGLSGNIEMILWGRTLEALDVADVGPNPSEQEIAEYIDVCIAVMPTDPHLTRWAADDLATADWPRAKAKVLKATIAYRDELLRRVKPGGEA